MPHGQAEPPAPTAPHSSRGPGHRPLKAEITGSNPVCGTNLATFWPDPRSDLPFRLPRYRPPGQWGSCALVAALADGALSSYSSEPISSAGVGIPFAIQRVSSKYDPPATKSTT